MEGGRDNFSSLYSQRITQLATYVTIIYQKSLCENYLPVKLDICKRISVNIFLQLSCHFTSTKRQLVLQFTISMYTKPSYWYWLYACMHICTDYICACIYTLIIFTHMYIMQLVLQIHNVQHLLYIHQTSSLLLIDKYPSPHTVLNFTITTCCIY